MSKTILYARVSTAEQTLKHQRDQAEQAGFVIDEVIEDEGISGVQIPLAERPNGKRLFDILRDGDVLKQVCSLSHYSQPRSSTWTSVLVGRYKEQPLKCVASAQIISEVALLVLSSTVLMNKQT